MNSDQQKNQHPIQTVYVNGQPQAGQPTVVDQLPVKTRASFPTPYLILLAVTVCLIAPQILSNTIVRIAGYDADVSFLLAWMGLVTGPLFFAGLVALPIFIVTSLILAILNLRARRTLQKAAVYFILGSMFLPLYIAPVHVQKPERPEVQITKATRYVPSYLPAGAKEIPSNMEQEYQYNLNDAYYVSYELKDPPSGVIRQVQMNNTDATPLCEYAYGSGRKSWCKPLAITPSGRHIVSYQSYQLVFQVNDQLVEMTIFHRRASGGASGISIDTQSSIEQVMPFTEFMKFVDSIQAREEIHRYQPPAEQNKEDYNGIKFFGKPFGHVMNILPED